jgi:hypothetical protein
MDAKKTATFGAAHIPEAAYVKVQNISRAK